MSLQRAAPSARRADCLGAAADNGPNRDGRSENGLRATLDCSSALERPKVSRWTWLQMSNHAQDPLWLRALLDRSHSAPIRS
eukprot:37845-Chlamydomonas_euryale.AAC.6